MDSTVIAYDLGTGGIKASLIDKNGLIHNTAFVQYNTFFSSDIFQDQKPEDWWNAIKESTKALLDSIPDAIIDSIKAISISGHSLGVVPIGKDGSLLREKTPIWSDQRALAQSEEFFKKVNYEDWYMKTGNGFPAPCYSVFKIMWYKDNEPDMYNKIDKVIGTKDYCNYRLCGVLATDYSYASGSGVYDLTAWKYDDDLIEASGIRKDIFPKLVESDSVLGVILPDVAKELGLNNNVKIVCGGVDNSCMALGAKGVKDGRVYTSLGTSAWIALVSQQPILDIKYKPYVFAHLIKGMYASATCIFSAGSSFQWVRNTFCKNLVEAEVRGGDNAYLAMNKLSESSVAGANGLFFNPSLAGGSSIEPIPNMCGAFFGLKLKHTIADIIRSTQEGIALNLRIALDVLKCYHDNISKMLIVGGGAKSPFWMQLFADIYAIPVEKTNVDQSAATLGAAALAFKAIGEWEDYDVIDKIHVVEGNYEPSENKCFYENNLLPKFKKIICSIAELENN